MEGGTERAWSAPVESDRNAGEPRPPFRIEEQHGKSVTMVFGDQQLRRRLLLFPPTGDVTARWVLGVCIVESKRVMERKGPYVERAAEEGRDPLRTADAFDAVLRRNAAFRGFIGRDTYDRILQALKEDKAAEGGNAAMTALLDELTGPKPQNPVATTGDPSQLTRRRRTSDLAPPQ